MGLDDNSQFTIRSKVLIALTGLPLFVLTILLYFSLKTIESDKIAYVFETASSLTNSLGAQVDQHLLQSADKVEELSSLFDSNQDNWTHQAQDFFQKNSVLEAILIFNPKNAQNKRPHQFSQYFEKEKGLTYQILKLDQLSQILARVPQGRFFLYEPKVNGFLIGLQTNGITLIGLTRMSSIMKMLTRPGPYTLAISENSGTIFYTTDEIPIHQFNWMTQPLEQIKGKESQAGTLTVKNSANTDVLLSYKKLTNAPFTFVSFVNKSDVISVIFDLLQEALLVFIILSATSVLIGILLTQGLTSSLTDLIQATQQITDGMFDIKLEVKSRDEVGRLAKSFNLMAMEIKRLIQETAEKSRMEAELKTAQVVQQTFFPPNVGQYPHFSIQGHYEPASECSGDWWFHYESHGKIYLLIGDATGHGVSAALMTGAISTMIESIRTQYCSPFQILEKLNSIIYRVFKGQIMMTFAIYEFDPSTNLLTYSNASHEPALLFRIRNDSFTKDNIELLNAVNSPRLGQDEFTKFEETSIQLQSGDRFFAYTDGIKDIQNKAADPIGERRVLNILLDGANKKLSLENSVKSLHDELKDYQELPANDDITFFMAEVI